MSFYSLLPVTKEIIYVTSEFQIKLSLSFLLNLHNGFHHSRLYVCMWTCILNTDGLNQASYWFSWENSNIFVSIFVESELDLWKIFYEMRKFQKKVWEKLMIYDSESSLSAISVLVNKEKALWTFSIYSTTQNSCS